MLILYEIFKSQPWRGSDRTAYQTNTQVIVLEKYDDRWIEIYKDESLIQSDYITWSRQPSLLYKESDLYIVYADAKNVYLKNLTSISEISTHAIFDNEYTSRVPDTGQTKCYDNEKEIPCPNPGEDFYGQDANYTINPQSFTKLDSNGNDLPDSATEWTMVRDNVTGLIWEVKTDDGSIHDKDNTYTWYDSNSETNGGDAGTPGDGTDTEDFIKALNDNKFGEISDWRLPIIEELTGILLYSRIKPTINNKYFSESLANKF